MIETDSERITRLERENEALRHDIANAVRCAKQYCPDYPWTLHTASEAVWACGEALVGTKAAIGDWDATVKLLEAKLALATGQLMAVNS